jgi:probable phosphoglycerate mutase
MTPDRTTTLIVTRHGETEANRPPRFHGRADLTLSKTGMAQARTTSRRIAATWRPSAVLTSPLQRCLKTGEVIGAPFGVAAQSLAELIDIDYGAWQGLTLAEVRSRWPMELEAWFDRPHRARIPGGESLKTVAARVAAVLDDILARHAGETIVIVGHNTINRLIVLQALGWPLVGLRRLRQDKCAVSELIFSGGKCRAGRINETAHLRHALETEAQPA